MRHLARCPDHLTWLLEHMPEGSGDAEVAAKVVEMMGLAAASADCDLRIADVPRLAEWVVDEYDGKESVSWGAVDGPTTIM